MALSLCLNLNLESNVLQVLWYAPYVVVNKTELKLGLIEMQEREKDGHKARFLYHSQSE